MIIFGYQPDRTKIWDKNASTTLFIIKTTVAAENHSLLVFIEQNIKVNQDIHLGKISKKCIGTVVTQNIRQ